MSGKRANGEGSIYPYKNGFAAYAWVTTPDGDRKRKYVYGKTREETHEKWIKLHGEASRGPVHTRHSTVQAFLSYWLESIVKPNLAHCRTCRTKAPYGSTSIHILAGSGSTS